MLVQKFAVAIAGLMGTSLAMACTNAPGSICINELLVHTSGNPNAQKAHEYIELRGDAGATIPVGTYFVAVDGDKNQNPGTIDVVIDLGGKSFGSNGFLVLLASGNQYQSPNQVNPAAAVELSTSTGLSGISGWSGNGGANSFERPSTTFFIVSSAPAPAPGQDIDGNNDGTPDGAVFAGWTEIDSVAASDNGQDRTYAAINFRVDATATTGIFVTMSVRTVYVARFGDSFGSTASAWVGSTAVGGSNPNWLTNATNVHPLGVGGKPLNHIGGTNVWPNAAPLHALPTAASVFEDNALVFSAGNGNAISVSDSDAGTGSLTQQLSVDVGTLTLATTAGITVDSGANGSAAMTISGTLAALNAALNGLSYTAPQDFNGSATLTINTNDNGSTGTDGAKSDNDTIALTINAVNDVPSFTVGANQSVAADAGAQTVTPFATNLLRGPADENGQVLDFIVSNNGNPLFTTQPAIAADGTLTYTPNASFTGTATVTVQIHDDGGIANGGVDTSATQTFTITTTAPLTPATVTSFDDNDADDLLPLNGTVQFDVTFSRNVDGSTAATTDFTFGGTGTATIDSVTTIDADTVQVTATATGAGTLILSLSGEVLDTFAIAVATPASDNTTLTVDAVAPTLLGVARAGSNPTNAATVDFTVTFSEAVSGIDAADFNLASAGVTGASITAVNGSGTTWTVTVGTGSGSGTVALGLAAAPVAQDIAGNALQTSVLATDYTIDRTAPLPVSISKLDTDNPTIPYVRFQVTFDEAVTGVDLADFSLVTTGGIAGAMIIDVSGSGTTWVVDVYTGLASGTIGLDLLDDDSIVDAASNALGAGLVGPTYTIDAAALAPIFKDGFETQPVL